METPANDDEGGNIPRIIQTKVLEDLENTNPTLLVTDDDKDRENFVYPVFFPSMKAATSDDSDEKIRGPDSPDTHKDSSSNSASNSGGGDLEQQEQMGKRRQEQQEQSPHKRPPWIYFCIAVVIATAAMIVAVFLLSDREDEVHMNDQLSPTSSPVSSTDNDDLVIPTVAPIGTQAPVSTNNTMTLSPTNLTATPTQAPTHVPTTTPTTLRPTQDEMTLSPTTKYPSEAPTSSMREVLISRLNMAGIVGLDEDDDAMTGDAMRVNAILDFLVEELVAMQGEEEEESAIFLQEIPQRYAMLSLDWQLSGYENILTGGNNRMIATSFLASRLFVHECSWPGVICREGTTTVRGLEWGHRNTNNSGVLGTEIGILLSLEYLDVSNNLVQSTIPEELYALVNLESVYLYKNQFTGTISSLIGNLWNLRTWHSSHNQLSGSIPETLRSGAEIRPLHTLNLYSNNMTGTLPENLRLRKLFYLDLGRNSFTGQLPADFADKSAALRLFHIDHNQFSGEIPPIYSQAGSGRVVSFSIDNNRFWGRPPVQDLPFRNVLVSYTMHNNSFSEDLDRDFCRQSVFEGGEMVEMKADCNICSCRGIFCDACVD